MIKGFRDFLTKNSVLALAIGFIMGAATGKVVSSLVADIIMPLISRILPGGEWRSWKYVLTTSVGPDGKEVVNAITYGNFLGNVVDFVVVAFLEEKPRQEDRKPGPIFVLADFLCVPVEIAEVVHPLRSRFHDHRREAV